MNYPRCRTPERGFSSIRTVNPTDERPVVDLFLELLVLTLTFVFFIAVNLVAKGIDPVAIAFVALARILTLFFSGVIAAVLPGIVGPTVT